MIPRNLSVSPERAVTPEWQKKSERRSMSSDGMSQRSSQSSTDWGYTSYNNFTASIKGGSNSNSNSNNNRQVLLNLYLAKLYIVGV